MRMIATLLLLIGLAATYAQQPGYLDTSFAVGGKLVLEEYGPVRDVVVQPDGKIVVLTSEPYNVINEAHLRSGPSGGTILMRLTDTGEMDASFGDQGTLHFDWVINAIEVRPDGRIVLLGSPYVMQLLSDGSVDSSFATNGVYELSFEGWSFNGRQAVLHDDDLVILADHEELSILLKLDMNGSLDTTFSDGSGYNSIGAEVFLKYPGYILIKGLGLSQMSVHDLTITNETIYFQSKWSLVDTSAPFGYILGSHRTSVWACDINGGSITSVHVNECGSVNSSPCPLPRGISSFPSNGNVFWINTIENSHRDRYLFHSDATLTGPMPFVDPDLQYDLVIQFSGKPIADQVGRFVVPMRNEGFCIFRTQADDIEGDDSWASGGYLCIPMEGMTSPTASVAIFQPDGKLLVGGFVRTTDHLARFVLIRVMYDALSTDIGLIEGNGRTHWVTIMPNPTADQVTFVIAEMIHEPMMLLQVIDVSGKLVKQIPLRDPTVVVDVQDLDIGLYSCRLAGKDTSFFVRKLVIDR